VRLIRCASLAMNNQGTGLFIGGCLALAAAVLVNKRTPQQVALLEAASEEPTKYSAGFDSDGSFSANGEGPGQALPQASLEQNPGPSVWPESLTAALLNAYSQNNGIGLVFKTLDSAALVMRLARALDSQLQSPALDAFYAKLAVVERSGMKGWQDFGTKVLVIEGLAGSGKTTLIQSLLSSSSTSASAANSSSAAAAAATFTEEPEVLAAKRAFCHSGLPEPVVKAFEFASNYFTAYSIRHSQHKVAIVERFYHAISAHTLCDHDLDSADVPQSAFDWPVDLPLPDLVVYLAVSTEQRMRRRKIGGGTSATDRSIERQLKSDRKMEHAYSLITGPVCVRVDAEGSPAETLAATVEACAEYDVPVPAAMEAAAKVSPQRISLGVYGAFS